MVQSCIVVGCTSRWEKGSKVSWHRVPGENNPDRRKKWLSAINRKSWIPSKEDRVCGRHFLSGCASQDMNDPDYSPSVDMGYDCYLTSTPKIKVGRHERAVSRRAKRLVMEQDEHHRHSAASILLELSNVDMDADTETSPPRENVYTESYVNSLREDIDQCTDKLAISHLEQRNMLQELSRLQQENRSLKTELTDTRFGVNCLRDNDRKTSFFTGVPNFATFLWLTSILQNCLPDFSAIMFEDAILLVLMKLKLNLQNFDLATRFRISESTVSSVLNRCIPIIADNLKFLIHWPEKEDVLRSLPKVFKPKYKNTRTIIDCTEIFVERPGNLTARAATWSNYKHHNTLKYLVAITPLGSISFISNAFGGRTSDKVVTTRSGFLDLLENGDLVLADRGFLISEEITARNCFLSIPAFTKGQTQLTQQQVETSRSISRVRIHVERAIGRLKTFNILSTQMNLSLVPHCDSILTICSAICNLQPKLVK